MEEIKQSEEETETNADSIAETSVEGETQAEVEDETSVKKDCPDCDGTGLSDKRTMGNAAQVLCVKCEGSGKV